MKFLLIFFGFMAFFAGFIFWADYTAHFGKYGFLAFIAPLILFISFMLSLDYEDKNK